MQAPKDWHERVEDIEYRTVHHKPFDFNTQLLPPMERKLLAWVQKDPENLCIAGGAALGLYTGDLKSIGDWDIYCRSSWDGDISRNILIDKMQDVGFSYIRRSAHRKQGELIMRFIYRDPTGQRDVEVHLIRLKTDFRQEVFELIRQYDLTCCCIAVCGMHYFAAPGTFEDIYWRRFSFNISVGKRQSVEKRVQKYIRKGFTPTDDVCDDIEAWYAYRKDQARSDPCIAADYDDIPF